MFLRKYPGLYFSSYQEVERWLVGCSFKSATPRPFQKEDEILRWSSKMDQEILLMVQFKIADEKRKYMECLKEIITKNYTSDFPEVIEIENHEEYFKIVREEE